VVTASGGGWKKVGKWPGGYIRQRGRERVFVIQLRRDKDRFHVSTGCSTREAAMAALHRWEANPRAFSASGRVKGGPEPVKLTADLVERYRQHQLAQRLTPEWVDEMERCLLDWTEAIGHLDLRQATLHGDLKPALKAWGKPRTGQRIKALKGFTKWLREEEGLLTPATDPTVDLRVPQAAPEKFERRKVVEPASVQAALDLLREPERSILMLLTGTAWHVSEARRFAVDGEIVDRVGGGVVLQVRHKTGEITRTPALFPEHIAAARYVRTLGAAFPNRVTLSRVCRGVALARALAEPHRALMVLLECTGWRLGRARAFARGGEILERPAGGAALVVRHGGRLHQAVIVGAAQLAAARDVRALGAAFPTNAAFAAACKGAENEAEGLEFGFGVVRHSVLTWGHQQGAPMHALKEFAGHHSETTTRRFYVDVAEGTAPIPLVRFQA
jgi:integrase